jgi:hypothetical protein
MILFLIPVAYSQQTYVADPTHDYGDAPDSYHTTLPSEGARHWVSGSHTPRLGVAVDVEPDGQPTHDADGDDIHQDDEDGVLVDGHLMPGDDNMISVRLTGPGYLHGWADLNRNGEFESTEKLISAVPVNADEQNLNLPVPLPPDMDDGPLYARFRITTLEDIPPFGDAPDGEVEDYLWYVGEGGNENGLDFGDAPGMPDLPFLYPTLLVDNGARHQITQEIFLGLHTPPDPEIDGQPEPMAKGDDFNGYDDEDGVSFVTSLIPGGTGTVKVRATVTPSTPAYLNAWIDFNADGDWDDSGEQIFGALALMSGSHTLTFPIPASAVVGPTFARFRLSSLPELPVVDAAPDGEVEDYLIDIGEQQDELDWGDAPDDPDLSNDYPTLHASNGAAHQITDFLYLGSQGMPDAEPDGQPHLADATGDDTDGHDDEDGVHTLSALIPGGSAQLSVTVHASSVTGVLNAWIDFNADGDWMDSDEHVFIDHALSSGSHTLSFSVPASAVPGHTIARFRLSSIRGLDVTGLAPDGEVEDHQLFIGEEVIDHDFGDLPDPQYATLLINDGARHVVPAQPQLFLGNQVDIDPDGMPDPQALGDDIADQNDDEDGVSFTTPLVPGQIATAKVLASAPGILHVWVDFNGSGDFQHHEYCVAAQPLQGGINMVSFQVPSAAVPGLSFARFRFSSVRQLGPTGAAPDGEVEDYAIEIENEQEEELDFGDAPESPDTGGYPTLLASDGARHVVNNQFYLGTTSGPDIEADGQPDASALGDDNAGYDDEDGVLIPSTLTPHAPATFTVDVTAPPGRTGFLNAWLDVNADGDWQDPGEHMIIDTPLANGTHSLTLQMPGLTPGLSVTRFRYSSVRGLQTTGLAPNGEVEDYQVEIGEGNAEMDFGDLPDQPYHTLLASNGARHLLVSRLYLGDSVDPEADGQPTASADGDDLTDSDDEDGVWLPSTCFPGAPARIRVKVMGSGKLNAWIDFDQNGTLDHPGEQILTDETVSTGTFTYTITIPASAAPGHTAARFRVNQSGGLGPNGPAETGEVEDYWIKIEEELQPYDFGDLPDRFFRTLLVSDGARHLYDPDRFMGALLDTETDGQPSPQADGDDNQDQDDEDGVAFTSARVQGQSATVEIVVSRDGFLNAWIDWNGNNHFDPPAEWVFKDVAVSQGANILTVQVPKMAEPGSQYARFRYCSQQGLNWFGSAPDGEVEDYQVTIEGSNLEWDYGDLPDSPYPTLQVSDGARHHIHPKIFLGRRIDAEPDGQPDPGALGDDHDGYDDEDGVIFRFMPHAPQKAGFSVWASTDGYLNAWIDWNDNGSFADAGDQIATDEPLTAGRNHLVISVPGTLQETVLYSRFRFNTAGGLSWDGPAEDGEVEDYILRFDPVEPDEWSVPIRLELQDQYAVNSFGVHPNATDDFDESLDVLAPPPPPDGISTFFECPTDPQIHLQTDMRSPQMNAETNAILWSLLVNADATTTLSWEFSALPPRGHLLIWTAEAGNQINMRRQNRLTVQGSQTIHISYSLHTPVGFNFTRQGWHMVSLPVLPDNAQVANLFPNVLGDQAYEWNPMQGEYIPVSELLPGHGYWLPVQEPASLEISGEPLDLIQLSLKTGWNMIGAPFDIASVEADPQDAIPYQFIEWDDANQSYVVAQELLATHAYWVWAHSDCELIIYSNENGVVETQQTLAKSMNFASPPPPPFVFTDVESQTPQPGSFAVRQNYPNPFNPATSLSYTLGRDGEVDISIYTVQGEKIRTLVNGWQTAGDHKTRWDGMDGEGTSVPSGLYLIRVTTNEQTKTVKALRLK